MALAEAPLLAQLLGIRPPWTVLAVLPSTHQRLITVQVGRARPAQRFWMRRETPLPQQHLRWEHLPLLGQRCQVLLTLTPEDSVPDEPWTGEAGQPFSRALSRQVIELLLAGATIEQLCVLLKLPVADLWRFKFRLDGGHPTGAGTAAPGQETLASNGSATRHTATAAVTAAAAPGLPTRMAASAAAQAGAALATATATASDGTPAPAGKLAAALDPVPPAASPVWRALLLGRVALEVRALSLRLLLSKLQREASLHKDDDLHGQAAADLQRYVLRNRAMLVHEIAQLQALAHGSAAAAPARDALPAVTDPLWMELLQGQRALEVRALGLKLLLSKLRSQIDRIHDDEVRMVKLVELHRYFERNKAMLGHELAQIGHWHAH